MDGETHRHPRGDEEPTPVTSRFSLPLSSSSEASLFQQTNAVTCGRRFFRVPGVGRSELGYSEFAGDR